MPSDKEDNSKAKFREALEKKKASNNPANQSKAGDPKFKGGQSGAGAPKMFRRKSGSS